MFDLIEDFKETNIEKYLNVIGEGNLVGKKFACDINKCSELLDIYFKELNISEYKELILNFEINLSENDLLKINEVMVTIGSSNYLNKECEIIFSSTENKSLKKTQVICSFVFSAGSYDSK